MQESIGSRFKSAWNAFFNRDPTYAYNPNIGPGNSRRPDRTRLTIGNEKSIVSSLYMRIALDVAEITLRHVKLDENDRLSEILNTGLNECLTLEANIDQTAKAFMYDAVMSMFDEGCVAIVPVDTKGDPTISGSYDILSMRTAKIVEWYPSDVRVNLYNDRRGIKEDLILPKRIVGIVENPLYAVMNEPNSTTRRLIRKLNLLDAVDEQSGSGKLDLVIQLPYVVKNETRKKQAEERRRSIEEQLAGTKYGIAYTDATERITQLNRSVENNLLAQVQFLTALLYDQLGVTEKVFKGTADDAELTNYFSRTVEPVVSAFALEYKRKFLTKTARSQRQSIQYFRDPFKLVPVSKLPDVADKFTRNEIMSPNDMRHVIGMKPSSDPKANELRNRNLSEAKTEGSDSKETPSKSTEELQNGG